MDIDHILKEVEEPRVTEREKDHIESKCLPETTNLALQEIIFKVKTLLDYRQNLS
jgi:hypothetical protein